MAFVPGFRHDVFVSYAHIDDEPLFGVQSGWVTTLVTILETVVRQKLGFKEFKIWMDHELARNRPLTPALMDTLRSTATLLIILSPGYLASEWCRREREAFLELVRSKRKTGVFVVYRDNLDRSVIPPELADLIGYPFWIPERKGRPARQLGVPVPSEAEPEYYDWVYQLRDDLSQELKRLRTGITDAASPPESSIIFLAEVTDDLETRRQDVRRYLSQAELNVLPQTYYPRDDPGAFEQAMRADLSRCKLFVQLLSAFPGRRPPSLEHGYPKLQYDLARQTGTRIMQWRNRDLDLTDIEDASHRALLECETVRACGIEEFKQAIIDAIRQQPGPAPARNPNVFVFVNTDSPDKELARDVCDLLLNQGIGYSMPLESGSPDEIRTDLEENLLSCDGLIVVYGATAVSWVRNQLRQARKIITQRERSLSAMAVFEGPPPDKAGIDLMLPNLLRLDCRRGLDAGAVRSFVESLA